MKPFDLMKPFEHLILGKLYRIKGRVILYKSKDKLVMLEPNNILFLTKLEDKSHKHNNELHLLFSAITKYGECYAVYNNQHSIFFTRICSMELIS